MQFRSSVAASRTTKPCRGFTLAEVAVALAFIALIFTSIIVAYTQATYRAEWTGYSLAAESLAMKQIEQARSARWDPAQTPPVCELYTLVLQSSNRTGNVLTGYSWTNLDLPTTSTNYVRATNYVTVQPVGIGVAGTSNIMVRVDSVWSFRWRNSTRLYTNTICTYVAPDNKPPEDL